ncbi:hypothetical protein Bbelb_042320 [Branchiostoma belcheri]|nr:hypothetical protein Bbelb_042320 [Branchiostoma belcheri]
MAHRRSKKDLILDDQGILLDDDEPIRQRHQRDVTFDDSHPFTDEPTLNLSKFEDSIKEEIEYGEGGASEEEFGGDGLDYGAGFEPAAFKRVRAGSQTQDSLDEFEAIEQNLLQDGSHASALFEKSREDDISFHSNENSVADQYEQYLSEQEHSRSGNEFSPGGEQYSPGLDDFAAKYGSQSARSYDGQYANEEGVEEDVSRLVGEESFPRNSFLDSSLLNDTVIPINASDSTYDKTPQPTFDHSKFSTPSPSNRRVSDLQSAGDHLVPPSKTPLTSTPNSPTDGKRPDISVQSVREDDSESRTPVGRPGSDLSPYSGFHERVSEIAKRDAAILRPRFTTYGAETKFSPPKTQRTPPTTDSGKKASNVSFKIDRSSGRILGVSQSTPQSDTNKNTSLRDRRRRNRMSRGDSGSRSKRRTETDVSVSDLDLDTSGRSDISRSELSQRLKEEVKSKTETSEQLRELQEEYDNLLAKYALAEVTIDHLRLGAKVNLYSDPPKPAPAFVGSIPQPHKIQMVDIPRSQRAQMDRTVEHRSQAVTATLSPPQPSHSRLTQTGMAVGTGTDPFVGEGEEYPTLTATASGESLKVALLLQAASLEDQVDSFEALLDLDQLNQAEQDEVLTRLQAENDRLNQDYLDARDEHDRRRRAGDTQGEFDEDKSVAGKLHQLGMRLEDLGERVENNRNNPTPDTTQQDTAPSLRDSVATEDSLIQSQMDLPLGEELEEQKRRVEAEFGRLMDRYSQLKGMPRTPDRDREIQELMQQLQELRRDAPLSLDLPEDLDDSLSQLSSPQLEETDLPEEERSRLPSRLLGRTPGQPSDQDMTRLDQSSLQFSPDSPDRKETHRQRDQVSEDDTPPVVRPKDRRNTSHSRAPKSQNKQQSCSVVDCTSSISIPHAEKHTTAEPSLEQSLPGNDITTDHNTCQSQKDRHSEGKSIESKGKTRLSKSDVDFDTSSLQNCEQDAKKETLPDFPSSKDRPFIGKDKEERQKDEVKHTKATDIARNDQESEKEKEIVSKNEENEETDVVRNPGENKKTGTKNAKKDEDKDMTRNGEKHEKEKSVAGNHEENEKTSIERNCEDEENDTSRNGGITSEIDKDLAKFVQECLEEPSSAYDPSASLQPATSNIDYSKDTDISKDKHRNEGDITLQIIPKAPRDLSEFHDINNESMPMVSLLLDSSPNSSYTDSGMKKHSHVKNTGIPNPQGRKEESMESVGETNCASKDFVHVNKTCDKEDNAAYTAETSKSDAYADISVVQDDVPSPDNLSNCRLTESRRSSTLFQPCRQSSHLPKPILKTQEHPIQHSHNMDRCDRCGQSQPSTHVGSTSSVADSGRSSPTHRPVAKATQNQPQQEAEIDSGFIGSESSRQSQMTTPLVPKRDPRATRERHRSPVTAQVTQKPSRPGSGHRSVTKHRPAPLQQVSDSDSPEERPTTVREVQPARTGGKKNTSKPQDMTLSQRRRPPSTRSRSSNTSHKRHYSSSEDDISRRSVASSRGSSRDDAIQGLKREIENMREELDDRLRRAQTRDRPGKSGLPSTPREPVRAYPMEGSYLEEEDDRREPSRPGSLKGPYTGKDYTPYATRRRAPLSETSPMDARDLRSSHSRTRTPSPVGSERRSTRRTRDRSTSPLNDTRPKELGRSDLGYTPRSYVRTTGPCPLCGGSGVHTHGEYVHPPPEPVEYRYVPVSSTAPVSPVVHYVPVSPRYVPTTPRTLRYEEVAPSPGVVYSPYPSPVVYVSPRRGRVRYYQRKYSVTETEEEEGDTDDELRYLLPPGRDVHPERGGFVREDENCVRTRFSRLGGRICLGVDVNHMCRQSTSHYRARAGNAGRPAVSETGLLFTLISKQTHGGTT